MPQGHIAMCLIIPRLMVAYEGLLGILHHDWYQEYVFVGNLGKELFRDKSYMQAIM